MSVVGFTTTLEQALCRSFYRFDLKRLLNPSINFSYSHGFLYPSEVKRVQRDVKFDLEYRTTQQVDSTDATLGSVASTPFGPYGVSPTSWSRSTVSSFGVPYAAPMADLTIGQSIEALVEGSELSRLREGDNVHCLSISVYLSFY